ncbi:MAG: mevalonate kinase, partial [Myxococcota bacterium]|nr:mevalonate kinase [Myxococcota bacterium]
GQGVQLPVAVAHYNNNFVGGIDYADQWWPVVLSAGALHAVGESAERLTLSVQSDLPIGAGLGGSAALAVALVRALDETGAMAPEDIRQKAHELEKVAHGTPSGIDDAVAAYGCPVHYVRGEVPVPMTDVSPPALWIGLTAERTSTLEAVAGVGRLAEARPEWFRERLLEVTGLVAEAEGALREGDWLALGRAMCRNHEHLRAIEVSTPSLDRLVAAALAAGAHGAKLTGGGLGGAVIAIAPEDVDLTGAWRDVGATEVIAP